MQASTKVTKREATAACGSSAAILAFAGDISSTSKDAILSAWHGLAGTSANLLLDFTAVDYINSAGIAIIIQMLLEAAGKQTVAIFGLSPHFQKVFTMVGINRYAALCKDEPSALAAL